MIPDWQLMEENPEAWRLKHSRRKKYRDLRAQGAEPPMNPVRQPQVRSYASTGLTILEWMSIIGGVGMFLYFGS